MHNQAEYDSPSDYCRPYSQSPSSPSSMASPHLGPDQFGTEATGTQELFGVLSPGPADGYSNTHYFPLQRSLEHPDDSGHIPENQFADLAQAYHFRLGSPLPMPSLVLENPGGSHFTHGEGYSLPSRSLHTGPETGHDGFSDAGDIPASGYQPEYMDVDRASPSGSAGAALTSSTSRPDTGRKRGRQTSKLPASAGKRARRSGTTSETFQCSTCKERFATDAVLQDHLQREHSRPLICVFSYAGCSSTFASKNEWKRHVLSQHLILDYWLCTDPACVRSRPDTKGTIFNRKDLYTQHVRRMHVPEHFKDSVNSKSPDPAWEARLREMQMGARQTRCPLPEYMQCPAENCHAEFKGTSAWDDRMEHVARHLDKPHEPRVVFGGTQDDTLTNWAASPKVNIVRQVGPAKWELVVPLKTTAKELVAARKGNSSMRSHDSDKDAECDSE